MVIEVSTLFSEFTGVSQERETRDGTSKYFYFFLICTSFHFIHKVILPGFVVVVGACVVVVGACVVVVGACVVVISKN